MKMNKIATLFLATGLMSPLLMAVDTNTSTQMGQGKTQETRAKNRAVRDNMTFEEMKAKMSASIEKRVEAVKVAQECVNSATTKEQLQACKPQKKSKKSQNKN